MLASNQKSYKMTIYRLQMVILQFFWYFDYLKNYRLKKKFTLKNITLKNLYVKKCESEEKSEKTLKQKNEEMKNHASRVSSKTKSYKIFESIF